jgi:hypothetical protein
MPHRIRPPSAADASAVLDVIHARDVAGVPPAPDVPLRTFEPADEAAVHRLIQDAFEEIEGNTPQTLEEWRAKGLAKPGHDPALWLLLEDDEGLAGAALGERWVRTVWEAQRWEKPLGHA